ncbi:hypothetical protein BJ322DRAFT_243359 [Thelephora terrestris]|uniref:Uncharacterized protein n=1 Tax=Thelephora terrestris TaxID=56493 RepID=A0A9P6H8K0_9AGAM|nr:hypothetical protein BJ322DRAFT_243359 [Thelephora terrestris]
MIIHSTSDSSSVFTDGKLKPGIYRIQNIAGHTYLDIRDESKELCCRPITVLEGKGLWEILPLGSGYSIRRLEQGKPEQYCIMLKGLESESVVSVSPFPVAWRIEIVEDERFRGCEYVRMFWGTTNMTWDLRDFGSHKDRTRVSSSRPVEVGRQKR